MEKTLGISDESSNSSDTEDSLDIAKKNWNRVMSAAKKTGYREGIEDGSESVFQEGFDKGYKDAFKTAFVLGKFKSLWNAMPQHIERPTHINEVLDKTRRGACYICKVESQKPKDTEKMSFSEIIDGQQAHSVHTIERLNEYFQPAIQHLNIEISDITKMFNPPLEPLKTE